jgi:hypothetical protein
MRGVEALAHQAALHVDRRNDHGVDLAASNAARTSSVR